MITSLKKSTFLVGFFSGLFLLLACQPEVVKKEEDKPIYVKGLFDLTGATSDVGVSYSKGVLDSIREANATKAIPGYKIEIDWKDYGYVANKAVDLYNEWKKDAAAWDKAVSIFGWGTADSIILSPEVTKDKKPYISASYAGSLASPQAVKKTVPLPGGTDHSIDIPGAPYNFFAGTDYSTSIRLAMQFIKDTGGKKIIFIYCNAGYCKDPIPAGKTYAAEIGLTVVGDIEVNLDNTAAQANDTIKKRMEEFKLEEGDNVWAWIGNTAKTAVYIAQGFAKNAPKNAKAISNVWGFDETVSKRCKDGWDAALPDPCVDRLFGVMPFAAFGDLNYPGMKDVVVQHKKYREADKEATSLYADVRYVQGYVSFFIWKKAVEKLIADKKEISGTTIKEALESFSELSTNGLTLNLKFSSSNHRPSEGALIYSVDPAGKLAYKKEVTLSLKEEWKGW